MPVTLLKHFTDDDWYHPEEYDQALSALYEGIWLDALEYGEAESQLLKLGYGPDEIETAVLRDPEYEYETSRVVQYNAIPAPIVKTPKRVDKKYSKEREQIKEIQSSLASEIAFARQRIHNFLKSSDIYEFDYDTPGYVPGLFPAIAVKEGTENTASVRLRVEKLEKEYDIVIKRLNALTEEVRLKIRSMNEEAAHPKEKDPREEPSELKKVSDEINANLKAKFLDNVPQAFPDKSSPVASASNEDYDEYYEEDPLFEERTDAIAAVLRKHEVEAEYDKKTKKIAKSQYVLDLLTLKSKTNREMMELTKIIRAIKKDGIRIRATKILSVQYGVRRLQVVCIVEDDKYTLLELKNVFKERNNLVERVEVVHIKKL